MRSEDKESRMGGGSSSTIQAPSWQSRQSRVLEEKDAESRSGADRGQPAMSS